MKEQKFYSEKEAYEEASRIKEKVKRGEAKDYREAEIQVAKEDLEEFIRIVTYLGSTQAVIEVMDLLRRGPWIIEELPERMKRGKTYEELLKDLEKMSDDELIKLYREILGEQERRGEERTIKDLVATMLLGRIYDLSAIYRRFEKAIFTLPFEDALKSVEGIRPNEINREIEVINSYYLARVFFDLKVTPENIEQFLDSSLATALPPEYILKKMNDEDAPAEVRRKIIDKYGDKINFEELPIYGEKSVFRGFPDRESREQKAVDTVVTRMIERLDKNWVIEARRRNIWSNYTPGFSLSELEGPLKIMREAAENGVVVPDYKDKLKKIREAIPYLETYAYGVIAALERRIGETELLLDKLSNKKPEGIKGEGLEFAYLESGVRAVYLDGELIAPLSDNAIFSDNPTNGEVVAWLESGVIDRDHIKGTQNEDVVYVWKKGWKNPKIIFEDHAWSSERYFRVFPPEVTPKGEVKIKRISGDRELEETFRV